MYPYTVNDLPPPMRNSAMEPFVKEHARWYVSNCISSASYTEIQDMNREINNVNWLWFDDGLIERLINFYLKNQNLK